VQPPMPGRKQTIASSSAPMDRWLSGRLSKRESRERERASEGYNDRRTKQTRTERDR